VVPLPPHASLDDPYRDIDRKLAVDADNLLVLEEGSRLIGSVMVGYEGHRGWINYLAVHPDQQRRGFGRVLMAEAENDWNWSAALR
jgi:ribosomal protein S18 acetylase RimI-like enzyme